jgi:hypothetical protein
MLVMPTPKDEKRQQESHLRYLAKRRKPNNALYIEQIAIIVTNPVSINELRQEIY